MMFRSFRSPLVPTVVLAAMLALPTLAIAGEDDPATPPPHLAEIAERVQDGRLLVVPHSAHLANAQQPQTITPAIISHLTGAAPHGEQS